MTKIFGNQSGGGCTALQMNFMALITHCKMAECILCDFISYSIHIYVHIYAYAQNIYIHVEVLAVWSCPCPLLAHASKMRGARGSFSALL